MKRRADLPAVVVIAARNCAARGCIIMIGFPSIVSTRSCET
eukprot:CAMPEP_0181258086 /NCGR_PEP_ID=MMETSP1096-20121128/50594_1 /TAXON_ID=156174 ORGANISM="Chrysochromulina ericina, Strain CCMP281" /NCGR_SAMPLE_ID=MMETSP1096 /ASSEMBLY_ACC=CAM_ASM_000453 /LENGTH=40 /DNA_ID= /DNA_START= /DNA_END= /DNA_ORIENTATION=